jgi:hypothetical protein
MEDSVALRQREVQSWPSTREQVLGSYWMRDSSNGGYWISRIHVFRIGLYMSKDKSSVTSLQELQFHAAKSGSPP